MFSLFFHIVSSFSQFIVFLAVLCYIWFIWETVGCDFREFSCQIVICHRCFHSFFHICDSCVSNTFLLREKQPSFCFQGNVVLLFSFIFFSRTRNQPFEPFHGWPFSKLFYLLEWDICFQQIFSATFSFTLVCSNETRGLKFLLYKSKYCVWI